MDNIVSLSKDRTVSLSKGAIVNLTKDEPSLKKVLVGLGWDPIKPKMVTESKPVFFGLFSIPVVKHELGSEYAIDCDASICLMKDGKWNGRINDVVYYGNLRHSSFSVKHYGDNLTGEGDGDDEQIEVNLERVPSEYNRLLIIVNIYRAFERKQNFGLVENAFIRLVDLSNNRELCRYDISDMKKYSEDTGLIFGELLRDNSNNWSFKAIGKGEIVRDLTELIMKAQ